MKRLHCILICLVGILLISGAWNAAQATQLPPPPPVPPETALSSEAPVMPSQSLDFSPLRAVLVVGPIDGSDGEHTTREKAHMDLVASELETHGVSVERLYTPQDDWAKVRSAADGAHFFFYRGHGVSWPSSPDSSVGGVYLSSGLVSPEQLRDELHLAPNAIVMIYGCFAAGSSSSDEGAISSEEARRRVAEYAAPFLDAGAAGYYSNWFGDAFQMFMGYLFQGKTLGQAYESFYDYDSATVERYAPPSSPDLAMWLDKDYWQDTWYYNNAFAGMPDWTLADLFQLEGILVEVSPPAITYLADAQASPRAFQFQVDGASAASFGWTATVSPDTAWLELQPGSGTAGDSATLVIMPSGLPPGTHQATVQVETGAPSIQQPATLSVTLYVVEEIQSVYLPLVLSSAAP